MVGKAVLFPSQTYRTKLGIEVHRTVEEITVDGAIKPLITALDQSRGVLLTSSYEYPGRYTRWDIGFVNPPLCLESRGRNFHISALNERGVFLLPIIAEVIRGVAAVIESEMRGHALDGIIAERSGSFAEEERSKQPSIFSVVRAVVNLFSSVEDHYLGLYGAFGYDLAFQFEPLRLRQNRATDQRDLVLYIPDELVIVDHRLERAVRHSYEFEFHGRSTEGIPRVFGENFSNEEKLDMRSSSSILKRGCDHRPGEYAAAVREAREAFKRGDLFEVVPGQTFFEPCVEAPSEIFQRLCERNPSPYGFFINLGRAEYLVGASPEMYVRVTGGRVETCPISGTIARGLDPIGDAAQVLQLLNSAKDESELTMCTDVDRNDKSRICRPGSVRVIGRRQIEMYSRLIHTVDHVEGHLRDSFDALDAFLAHTWAVTVTGAPKVWAMQFLEDHEKSPRAWYGGAVGLIGFDGNMNTGLTLRTIRIKDGVAEVRVGATLLYDSDPAEEERETHLKAEALLDAIRRPRNASLEINDAALPGRGKRVLLVDHQDSFVHTLANYLRQTGAEVITLRSGFPLGEFTALRPDLVVLSPGPGTPKDFGVSATIASALSVGLPVFGVCMGLQGMVEHFGGELGQLSRPVHGKASRIHVLGGRIFRDFPPEFTAGRYHSLYAVRETLPRDLQVTAESEDGVIMGIEHATLPLAAVQFHPESILSLKDHIGLRLVRNLVTALCSQ
jgi:anthranilate synthase